jgi:hypothetical protein
MSTRNLPGGKGRLARKADNLTAICEPRRLTTLWVSTAYYRDSFTFIFAVGAGRALTLLLWRERYCIT